MKIFLAFLVLAFTACQQTDSKPTKQLQGEWSAENTAEGQTFTILARFKDNGTVDVMANGKLIISQQYRTVGDSVIFAGDPNCAPGSEGVYQLTYLQDSIRFNIVRDSCEQRIANTDKAVLGRVKTKG